VAQVIDRIRTWAAELRYWEQAALELIANGTEMTEVHYQRLLDLCMHDAGLLQLPSSPRPPLSFPTRENGNDGSRYRIERLFNLQNVNALPCGQEISFGERLTLIYGDNGVGKTGYARPLASAAFARGERNVLPNAGVASAAEAVPKADIELSQAGSKRVVTWTRGQSCKELAGFYVFDSASMLAHLTGSNALSFSPSGLFLLTKLASVTDDVRSRLKKLLDARSVPHTLSPLFLGESAVAAQIQMLGAGSDVKVLQKLATLTEKDHARIPELETEIARLKLDDIPKRRAELRQNATDLRRLSSSLVSSEQVVGPSAASAVEHLLRDLQTARRDAEQSGAERFRVDSFRQVGTEVWREFLMAARSLAEAEEPDGSYPLTGRPCLLCRQPLSQEATALVRSLWEFLASDATARFEVAQQACVAKCQEIERTALPYFGEDSRLRRTLNSVAPDLALAIEKEIEAQLERSRELVASLQGSERTTSTTLAPSDKIRLAAIAKAMESEAESLQAPDVQKKLDGLSNELRDLLHRRTLSEQLPAVKSYVETQRWIQLGRQSFGSTHSITAKHNELFKELVTDRFLQLFQSNLADLNRSVKVTIDTHGKKGDTVRQIVLSPAAFPAQCSVESVLSDGEKRIVALADFLTEAALDDSCTGIILDDPVTSFDLGSKKEVASKLAGLARTRQVVVFTHDLAFLYHIKTEAKTLSVGAVTHWITRGPDGTPGLVFLNNSPVCEGDYRSARIAREWHSKALSAPPQEQQSFLEQGFGALRTSYEAFVIFELFAGVVERWAERIKYDQLAQVSLDKEIVDQVVQKLGDLSRYIEAHLHSDAFIGQKPTPANLFAEIESYEALKAKHKQLKKAAQQSSAAPKVAAGEQPQGRKLEEVPVAKMTPENIELEQGSRAINPLRNRN
jgi:energy-coupling factor transporter ATP-binding protein EcfA2